PRLRRRSPASVFREARSAAPSRVVFGFPSLVAPFGKTETSVPVRTGLPLPPHRHVKGDENEAGGGVMATLEQAGQVVTKQLREQKQQDEPRGGQQESEQSGQESGQNGSSADDVTKEELLDRAREVNVHGRSSMTKDQLLEAVEAEESLTKEELLERARQAG